MRRNSAVWCCPARSRPQKARYSALWRSLRGDQQAVVLADQLVSPVAQRGQEVVIGRQHAAVQVKLDHRLRLADGLQLPGGFSVALHAGGHVLGNLDHTARPPAPVAQRVVAGLQPQRLAVLALAAEFTGLRLSPLQRSPEAGIGGVGSLVGTHQQAVVLAHQLSAAVAGQAQELRVRVQDAALQIKLDGGLGLHHGRQSTGSGVGKHQAHGQAHVQGVEGRLAPRRRGGPVVTTAVARVGGLRDSPCADVAADDSPACPTTGLLPVLGHAASARPTAQLSPGQPSPTPWLGRVHNHAR